MACAGRGLALCVFGKGWMLKARTRARLAVWTTILRWPLALLAHSLEVFAASGEVAAQG